MSADVEKVKKLMARAREALAEIESYTCTIHCHERIKGKVRKPESIFSRYQRPGSVYLRWQPGPYEGLQSSHVPHRDGPDKFQAREKGLKGLAGAVTIPHGSPLVDKAYPHHFRTHETNLRYLIDLSDEVVMQAIDLGTLSVLEIGEVTDPFIKRPATKVAVRLSTKPSNGLRWSKAEFYFDHQTNLPLHFKLYDFDGEMTGEYAFTDIKANVPLSDDDFVLKKL